MKTSRKYNFRRGPLRQNLQLRLRGTKIEVSLILTHVLRGRVSLIGLSTRVRTPEAPLVSPPTPSSSSVPTSFGPTTVTPSVSMSLETRPVVLYLLLSDVPPISVSFTVTLTLGQGTGRLGVNRVSVITVTTTVSGQPVTGIRVSYTHSTVPLVSSPQRSRSSTSPSVIGVMPYRVVSVKTDTVVPTLTNTWNYPMSIGVWIVSGTVHLNS